MRFSIPVIAGEVRALGRAGNMADLFAGLIALASEVISYRWLAFAPEVGATRKMFLHTRDADRHSESTSEARATCTLLPETATEIIADDRLERNRRQRTRVRLSDRVWWPKK